MSNKFNSVLLILKLAIILLIPSLFFSYVGHDPLRETKNQNVKSIALVNEDVGFEFEKNPLTLGKEMSEVIGKSSSYQWVTVNRKTAETGLHSGQYEAIIYLPSNFTESVLSFTDDQPKEASVTYKIQPNINAERAEKVLKELETAKNKINTNMSTIYWNYVSQSVDD
ncbi:MAG: type VII secretion protein EsaA, partial [Bacillus sp. (in: firmicutes)]